MTPQQPEQSEERPFSHDLLYALRYYLSGRTGLLVLGGGLAAVGVTFSWSWLVAIGAAPLLIALLPCAAMCAAGVCMYRMGGKSGASGQAPAEDPRPARSPETLDASASGPALPEPRQVPAGDPAPRIMAAEPSPKNLERQPVDERSS